MGLFFEKKKRKKSSKPVIIIRTLITIAMVIIFIMGIIHNFDSNYFRLIFIFAGVIAVIDGLEGYFKRENKSVYLSDISFGVFYLILAFVFFV